MSLKERINNVSRKGWIRAGIWSALYIVFVVWVAWGDWASLGWLVLLPIIADMFTTKIMEKILNIKKVLTIFMNFLLILKGM